MGKTQWLLNGHIVNVIISSQKKNAPIIIKFFESTVKQNAPYNKNDKNIAIWAYNKINTAFKIKGNIQVKYIWVKLCLGW